jgi:hypothetical protein
MAQDRDRWRVFVIAVMKFPVPKKCCEFLDKLRTCKLLRKDSAARINGVALQWLVALAVVILLNSDDSSVSHCPRLCCYSICCHIAPPAWSAWTLDIADAKTGVVCKKCHEHTVQTHITGVTVIFLHNNADYNLNTMWNSHIPENSIDCKAKQIVPVIWLKKQSLFLFSLLLWLIPGGV